MGRREPPSLSILIGVRLGAQGWAERIPTSGRNPKGAHLDPLLIVLNIDTCRIRTGDTDGKCIKIDCSFGKKGWAGIYWQHPENIWGDTTGVKIIGAPKVTFWACCQNGGEKVQFKSGGNTDETSHKYTDSFTADLGWETLSDAWTFYEIDLPSGTLSHVIGGFVWISSLGKNIGEDKISFYLDEIRYE